MSCSGLKWQEVIWRAFLDGCHGAVGVGQWLVIDRLELGQHRLKAALMQPLLILHASERCYLLWSPKFHCSPIVHITHHHPLPHIPSLLPPHLSLYLSTPSYTHCIWSESPMIPTPPLDLFVPSALSALFVGELCLWDMQR